MDDDPKASGPGAVTTPPPGRVDPISVRSDAPAALSDFPPVVPPEGWKFGRYELLGRLAYGGMAEIYLARESAYGLAIRYVVIKRVLPHISTEADFVELFMDEARVAMSLTNPHICHIYEFGRLEGSYFLAMEWVNGASLNRLIRRLRAKKDRLPLAYAVKIIAQVAEALDYSHSVKDEAGAPLGIVHRDVTPHNIMVSFDGAVKLLDFGIAKATSRNTQTQTGIVRGKFAYMSPQHCVGQEIDGRSDVFSLGVVLYEALTGERLYKRETDFEACQAIIDEPVPSVRDVVPDLPEHLDAIVQKALAKQPEDRFQTAGEMQQALQEFLADRRDVVPVQQMAERMRDLFPKLYADGPNLDVGTELLNSLERVDGVGADSTPSIPGPAGLPTISEDDRANEVEDDALSATATAMGPVPIGRGTLFAFLALLLLAVGLGGVAVWAIVTRPSSPEATAPTPAPDAVAPRSATDEEPVDAQTGDDVVDEALQGTLWITSEPPGADIYINSNPTGEVTPAQLTGIWPGRYRITLRMAGHDDDRMLLRVEAGQIAQASGTLQAWSPGRIERAARENDQDVSDTDAQPTVQGGTPDVTPEGVPEEGIDGR